LFECAFILDKKKKSSDYLFEDKPLVNKFISVPKDQSKILPMICLV